MKAIAMSLSLIHIYGKSLMLALSQDVRQNRPVEAREHVRRFHELFFTLSPEKSAIEPVSYTHLDVYKRQILRCSGQPP